MDSPAQGDHRAHGAGKCAAFGSVGMSMALPKPAGAGALGASTTNQAFKRQRTAYSVRCQESKGADLMIEECLSDTTSSNGVQGQGGEEDTAEEKRCPLCHQLTLDPSQVQNPLLADRAYSSCGPHRLRQAVDNTSVTPQRLMVNGGLLLATFLGQKVLRWILKRRRRKNRGAAPMETEEGEAAHNTDVPQGDALSHNYTPAEGSYDSSIEAQASHLAYQSSGAPPASSFLVESGSKQGHRSAARPARPFSKQPLARATSPEQVNHSLYQYAALALQHPTGPRAKRR